MTNSDDKLNVNTEQMNAITAMLDALKDAQTFINAHALHHPAGREGVDEILGIIGNAIQLAEKTPITLEEQLFDSNLVEMVDGQPKPNKQIKRANLARFLQDQHGRFIGVDFIEGSGTPDDPKELNGRIGVRFPFRGTPKDSSPLFNIYDTHCDGYCTIDLTKVCRIRAMGDKYDVID